MQGVWGKAADQGDRSEGEGLKEKEARRFVKPGHRQTCDHANEVGLFFFFFLRTAGSCGAFSIKESVGWICALEDRFNICAKNRLEQGEPRAGRLVSNPGESR